jgi:hypothetical protein
MADGGGGTELAGQGEAVRVPQADGTLVVLPVGPEHALMPSLLPGRHPDRIALARVSARRMLSATAVRQPRARNASVFPHNCRRCHGTRNVRRPQLR